jgi:hypothetical protein
MKIALLVSSSAFLVSLAAPALAAPPSADDAMKVVTWYYDGKDDGPLLLKAVPCLKIDDAKDSKTKNECIQPAGDTVPKGSKVSLWTAWMVPVGGKFDDITVQFLLDGTVRETKDVSVAESWRTRTWSTSTLSKPGKWEIKILRGGTELSSSAITVQ